MATPPLSPHSGPAWTRKQQQTAWSDNPPASTPTPPTASSSPRKTPRTRPARSPYGVGGPAFANSAPLIAASLSGAGSGSVSTLSLPAQTTTQDAPYLTHIHRHHGQLTLVAPDNLGARRQPGTVDPPERRVDAGGGWGISPPPLVEDESAEPNVMKKKKRKKKSALEQRREREEREKRERDILSAVQNAGRTPSPSRASAFDAGAVRSTQMGRTRSGASLEVPGQQETGRRRRSRSRIREGESQSVESSSEYSLSLSASLIDEVFVRDSPRSTSSRSASSSVSSSRPCAVSRQRTADYKFRSQTFTPPVYRATQSSPPTSTFSRRRCSPNIRARFIRLRSSDYPATHTCATSPHVLLHRRLLTRRPSLARPARPVNAAHVASARVYRSRRRRGASSFAEPGECSARREGGEKAG